jgi:hypothetical protein
MLMNAFALSNHPIRFPTFSRTLVMCDVGAKLEGRHADRLEVARTESMVLSQISRSR